MANIPRADTAKYICTPRMFRAVVNWLHTYCANVVYICGDVHAHFAEFSQKLHLLKLQHPKQHVYVFVCGDFGHWPKYGTGTLTVPSGVTVYFCPGNHEDWVALDEMTKGEAFGKAYKLDAPRYSGNVYFCDFGCVVNVLGKNFMFCGGASSIDRAFRKEGVSWFPQEVISDSDMDKLLYYKDIDVVISHTCPTECTDRLQRLVKGFRGEKVNDPSSSKLSEILKDYKPKQWFFGHWHVPFTQKVDDCTFLCLSDIEDYSSNWIIKYE